MSIINYVRAGWSKHCVVVMALLWGVTAGAANVYVVPPGTLGAAPDGQFLTWATAATNIQTAINAIDITGGNTVFVSNGVYVLTNDLSVTKGVYLRSWSDGLTDRTNTIVDGGNYEGRASSNRCITINHAQAVVDGFTFRNGVTDRQGGGVLVNRGLLTNCLVVSNNVTGLAFGGGGINIDGGPAIITHCDILYNLSAAHGGGVSVAAGSSGEINNCLIAFNVNTNTANLNGGGGYMSRASDFVCRNCVIRQNTAVANGGGVMLWKSGGLVENCEILDNLQSATSNLRSGSGVTIWGAGTVRNCLIAGNRHTSAHPMRAAVQLYAFEDGIGVLENCTVVGNTSRGVVFVDYSGAEAAIGLVRNSIVYDNIFADYVSHEKLIFTNCCTTPLPAGSGNTDANPLFVNPTVSNYQLQGTSPCIDAGVNLPWMDTVRDLANQRRIDAFAHVVDMGCYEFQPSGMTLIIR